MDNITTKTQYDGTTTPVPATSVHTAGELNDRIVETQGAVTDSGQSLAAGDAGQLSKAMFANGVAAQSMFDVGGVNSIVLTPITGASGLRVATPVIKDYSLLNGAIFSFKAKYTNTGDMSVNLGQSSPGGLIGAQPLFMSDGSTEVPVGMVVADRYYEVRYDSSLDVDGAFVLLSSGVWVPEVYTGGESITFPNGVIFKQGVKAAANSTTYTITFGSPFPNNCLNVMTSYKNSGSDGNECTYSNTYTASNFKLRQIGITSSDVVWQAWGY